MAQIDTMITSIIRQVVLDTETTGINQIGTPYKGHKIIEIGAVEIINRKITGNNFHTYLKPDRLVDPEAFNIHGISNEFLFDKPTFAEKANEFLNYIKGAELIIHNASFDIGFIDYELSKLNLNFPKISTFCKVIDTMVLARRIFPGKRNSLNALCSRYGIDSSKRTLHSALLDANILAEIYLAMTGGQTSILFMIENENQKHKNTIFHHIIRSGSALRVILANDEELAAHRSYLDLIQKKGGNCIWRAIRT